MSILCVVPAWAALPSIDSLREDKIKTVVQQAFEAHGFPVEKSNIILISDDGKMTIALDISESVGRVLMKDILESLRTTGLSPFESNVEINLFGTAESAARLSNRSVPRLNEWNDVLAKRKSASSLFDQADADDQLKLGGVLDGGLPVHGQPLDFEKARSVILIHLLKIRDSGIMGNTILMESYWKEVFAQAGVNDLFEVGRPLVAQALAAGIKPYRSGKPLEASAFADLAMDALGLQPVKGTGASVILFRP